MKRPILILISLFSITLCLSLAKIVVANSISTNGIELGLMESKIQSLDTQNLVLQEKLLSFSSLNIISVKAEKIGFVPTVSSYFVDSPVHVALKQ